LHFDTSKIRGILRENMSIQPNSVIKFSRQGVPIAEYTVPQVPEAFRQKKVLATDHYWCAGMAEWKMASELLPLIEAMIAAQARKTEEEKRSEAVAASIAARKGGMILVTTTPIVQGYRVKEYLGMTRGIIVRTPNIFEGIGGAVGMFLGGGQLSAYIGMCEKTRQEAYDAMLVDARAMGANAIIGVAYDANEVMEKCTEVLCYGTAVILEREVD
jgi:uncharacterized protein YbjQ (UPF0145 family)